MTWIERLHFLHRAWRYRLRSEKFGVAFLLSRALEGKTAVDVGANRGIFSYWMHKKVGARGRVVAFEPQAELAASLADLRRCFRLDRLEIFNQALSSVPGERDLLRPKDHWGGASLESASGDVETLRVPVTTLDDHFDRNPGRPIAFVKCDVEGHEHEVFRGAERILREDRPDLLFECHDAADPECRPFRYLADLGYEGFCFLGRGFAPVSRYSEVRPSMHPKALVDFVFVPRERAGEMRGPTADADPPRPPSPTP